MFNNFFSNVYNAKEEFFLPQGPISESISTRINFTLDDVKSILGSLNVQKACGEDGVPNIFLNKLGEQLAPSIFLLMKNFTCKKIFPAKWKRALISPIFKDGDKSNVEMYRPVALLACVSKVYEKINYEDLFDHFCNQISKHQFDFLKEKVYGDSVTYSS